MRKWTSSLLVLVLPAISFLAFFSLAAFAAPDKDLQFTDVEAHTARFHAYERTIKLTPEQNAIFREALQGLRAPCCPDNTALTCCCPCNSARAWWGLAKHLVADLGYDATATRAKVDEWFRFINPSGWSGDTCNTAGCSKPFAQDGCGGMNPNQVVF